jgi:hypothetical protein
MFALGIDNRETPLMLSILVQEDLVMAAYLPVVGMLLSGGAGSKLSLDRVHQIADPMRFGVHDFADVLSLEKAERFALMALAVHVTKWVLVNVIHILDLESHSTKAVQIQSAEALRDFYDRIAREAADRDEFTHVCPFHIT